MNLQPSPWEFLVRFISISKAVASTFRAQIISVGESISESEHHENVPKVGDIVFVSNAAFRYNEDGKPFPYYVITMSQIVGRQKQESYHYSL